MKFKIIAQIIIIMTPLSLGLNLSQVKAEQKPFLRKEPYGGTLIWGTKNKPTIINPILTTHSVSMSLQDLIFNKLVRMNAKGEIEPDLAESWNVSEDGLTYTFYLRKGVRFHDGAECTAKDALFTFREIMNPENNSAFALGFALVESLDEIDNYTLKIRLKRPHLYFIFNLSREIAPEHLLKEGNLKDNSFNYHPIGTGPFRFKEWKEDNTIILEANADYFEGRPYLDGIIVKTYPDSSALWSALMRAEVDLATFIEQKDYEIVKQDQTFKAYAIPIDYYFAIAYNLEDKILSDRRIRYAIAYAINRKELIQRVAGGYGIDCLGPFYPESEFFYEGVKPFEYNPEKAKELLSEAGWEDLDKDGILEKDGDELELKILIDERSDIFKRIAMLIRQQLQEVGMKITVLLYSDECQLTPEFLESYHPQMYLRYYFANILRPDDPVIDWYSKSGCFSKLWIYKNRDVDRLFELGLTTKDKQSQKKIYKKIHQLIYDDQPACFLFFPVHFHTVSAKFKNIEQFFNSIMPFYIMKDWYLEDGKTERR